VEEAAVARRRAVLVVFGRGRHSGPAGPVLREVVIDSLCRPPLLARVLAFSSASPAQGGEGALVILLRRPTEND
jgi:DNA-nicking Smr family endonuclease